MINLKKAIEIFNKKNKKPDIYLVANAQDYTKKISEYDIIHSSNSEFFSAEELGEIASSLFEIGCYVSIFYTELDFIKFVLNNNYRLDYENLLILNLSRDGNLEGKKSLVPAFCDMMGIRYSGSNPFVVSLCRNKFIWSSVLKNHGINVPDFFAIKNNTKIGENSIKKDKKVIIKNIFESASIGLDDKSVVTNLIIDDKFLKNNENILIQDYVEGREIEVPFFKIGKEFIVSNPVCIDFFKGEEFLTSMSSDAYNYGFSSLNNISLSESIKEETKHIAEILGLNVYGRVDYRIDKNNKFFVIDIATMPYTINHSSFAYWFEKENLKYSDLYKILLLSTENKYLK
ncbi:TPA: ATP-grasp domain-containing protein [Streptococcus agalactiae]|nr:ATP-grasp domain protein [Tissierellia bacterium KA00581]